LLKDKKFLVNNNLKPLSFHVVLDIPIDLFFFKEIINILKMKYIFFEKSKILISNYELDSNQRILSKNNQTVKLTEKELSLILGLKKKSGVNKSELLKSIWNYNSKVETHTFETNLYRLRKKIEKKFNDKNFIYEKGSCYYLS
jgi:DNA-binding response OmpR family regulator